MIRACLARIIARRDAKRIDRRERQQHEALVAAMRSGAGRR